MGNTIPRHPCEGCHERPSLRVSANIIDAHEAAVDRRSEEIQTIRASSLGNQLRSFGRMCSLLMDNSHDRATIRTIKQHAEGVTSEDLATCPGLLSREIVILNDKEDTIITETKHLCSTVARLRDIDTTGWELPTPPVVSENRLDLPVGWDED